MPASRQRDLSEDSVFTSENFWSSFEQDLRDAKFRVIIQSPFLAYRRIQYLSKTLSKLVARGVAICVFIQAPRTWGASLEKEPDSLEERKALIEMLEKMNIHVSQCPLIHEKLAVVDEFVLWDGSLNVLSHSSTKERMHRFTSLQKIKAAIALHSLDKCTVCTNNYANNITDASPKGLGHQLAKYRTMQNLSQRDVSRTSKISQSRISQFEHGSCNPTLDTLFQLAHELDVEPVLVPKMLIPLVTRLLRQYTE